MNTKIKQKLREIFNKHDPIGIYENDKINVDEYDPEISGLIIRFKRSKNEDEFLVKIHALFIKMFSDDIAGPKQKYKKLAQEIYSFLKESLKVRN